MTWFFIFIPILVAVLLLVFFLKKIVWWELSLLIGPSALIILLMNTIMISYRTSDTEYLGFYTKKIIYYQAWDERVSCRHPIYCTRSCGKNCTTTYVCGHVHSYDVDYHPEHWMKQDNSGSEYSISQTEYNILKECFATKTYFVDLHRNYHSIDGDSYCTDWGGEPEKSDILTKENSYTNKIKASHSIFKFEDITDKQKTSWKLYDYPAIKNMYQPVVLGYKIDAQTERKLQYLNGFYGKNKQFKLFVLFYKGQSQEAAFKQRSYWEGGNKNEFVVCLGIDNSNKIEWVKSFSWMDKPELEVEVQEYFNNSKNIDLNGFADWMPMQIEKHWHRKDFKDFDYLEIELTDTQIWWVLIIVMIYNIFISVWVVKNEF